MKRAGSIFFLFLILLNAGGYYGALVLIEHQNLNRVLAKISDNEGEISGNILLKIPIHQPYRQNDNEYKRAHGEIVIDGTVYYYVKSKFYQDTLYIVCLEDSKSTRVGNEISDVSKTFSNQRPSSETATKITVTTSNKFYIGGSNILRSKDPQVIGAQLLCRFMDNLYAYSSINYIFRPPC